MRLLSQTNFMSTAWSQLKMTTLILFDILAKGRSDTHCKIKETLLIRELKPALNNSVSSEKFIFVTVEPPVSDHPKCGA